MNKTAFTALLSALGLSVACANTSQEPVKVPSVFQLQLPEIAKKLGWVNDPSAHNLCKGYYRETPIKYRELANSKLIDYDADRSRMNKKGLAELLGHVVLTQDDKQIHTDKVQFYRNPKTNKPERLKLTGNVAFHEPGRALYAGAANFWLGKQQWQIDNVLYRFMLGTDHPEYIQQHNVVTRIGERRVYELNAWGRADHFKQSKKKVWDLYNATYTTCSPTCHVWHIKASHIHLDKNTNIGTAKNVKLYVKNVPVFWFPYLSFPLNNKRKSGFLLPTYGTSTTLGPTFSFPFYWNMAPNYDTILTPNYSAKRGWYLENYFRYLTPSSTGNLSFNLVLNDSSFKNTVNTMKNRYSGDPTRAKQLSDIESDSATRTYLNWQDSTQFNEHLFAKVDYQHVSDDYYMQDFQSGPNVDAATADQLPQDLSFDYYAKRWRANMSIEHYQTLHPLNQADIYNQYSKLPTLSYSGLSAYQPHGIQFSLTGNFINYNKTKNPFDNTLQSPTVGEALDVLPSVAWPKHNRFFFFKPQLTMDLTAYDLHRPNPGAPSSPSRAVPVFDIYSGLYYDRRINLFGGNYIQTFEPQVYYLYVPYRNQNNFPLFNTVDNSSPLSFNYDQMFAYNRFSNFDRIGDANQVTLAATTRFRNAQTGEVKASASIGEIIYFRDRRVLACTNSNGNNPSDPSCPGTLPSYNKQRTSPIAGQVTYNINRFWHVSGDMVYNDESKTVANQTLNLSYSPDYRRVINVGYTYARNGNVDQTAPSNSTRANLEQTTLSSAWPINEKWEALGQINYSISRHDFQSYLYGLEYDSCCWSLRLVANRSFTGLNPGFSNQYDTQYYLQFSLNGFTNIGTRDPSSILSKNIGGYHNYFGEEY